jgi:hypothetical protein
MPRAQDTEKERLAQISALLEYFRKVRRDTDLMITSLETERDRAPHPPERDRKKR